MPANSTTKNKDTLPTLTEVTAISRKVIKYSTITLVSFMVLRLLVTSFVAWWRAMNPPPPPPPTVGFGKLPAINLPGQEFDPRLTYKLETADGRFPTFPDRAKVFLMPGFRYSLLADERVRDIATTYGFQNEPQMLDSVTYRWLSFEPLNMIFEIELYTYNFTLSSDYHARPELIVNPKLPDEEGAEKMVKNYLSRTELLADDMATASAEVRYLKALGGELLYAVSLSDADFLEVVLNRVPVDGRYRMYTPDDNEGSIKAIIAGVSRYRDQIVSLKYRYQPVDYSSFETYPLRPVSQAWEDLKAGNAYIIYDQEWEEIIVRNIVIGYFDDFAEQEYLQPIYVFIGDDGFLAYTSAIPKEYYIE